MPKPARAPIVGESVHFYEHRLSGEFGPLAALVTYVSPSEWRVNHEGSVHLAVIGEATVRHIPDVPFDDGGAYAGCWWRWPEAVERVHQSGL